ncbi:MAG: dockerin type I domain-containing protein [Pirellulaceae bacterium]
MVRARGISRSPLRALRCRSLSVEPLETRRLLTSLPFGAATVDTGEFMLGSVVVTPVLLESNGQIDASTENWTPTHIQEVMANIREGLDWWVDLLATQSALAPLSFTIDTAYADTPVASSYEPISRRSNDYSFWTNEFLNTIDFQRTSSLEADMRAFNNAQRVKSGTDWAMTIFVVDSRNDSDSQFAVGGSFSKAFSFAGGLFMVVPSTRPASTYAHETGHLFWARDEYAGGGSYSDFRGYYNTQNTNAANNPTPGFVQQPSIMAASTLLETAYSTHTSPASTLAMVGWQDSDGDGVFDVLDVPHQLTGTGYWDAASGDYKFVGNATVRTLPNRNPSGQGNDITINRIREIEVRFDGGPWQTVALPNVAQAPLDLSIPVPSSATQLEIRARDSKTSVVSNVFVGHLSRADAATTAGINGAVWVDANHNGLRDVGEFGQPGWTVELIDGSGAALSLRTVIEPDDLPGDILPPGFNPKLALSSVGTDSDGRVAAITGTGTSTGTQNFQGFSKSSQTFTSLWNSVTRRLQANFATPTGVVQIDAIAPVNNAIGRLEAYNAAGELLERYTTAPLGSGQVETMTITRPAVDIAYIIVGGYGNFSIKLDNLQFGPQSVTTTGPLGTYSFPALPSGNYTVRATALGDNQPLDPHPAIRSEAVFAGAATLNVDFGFASATHLWHNERDPVDVNDDGLITPIDALLIINELNRGGARSLLGSNLPFPPYIDTNADGLLTANDVLQVINYINAHSAAGRGGEGEPSQTPVAFAADPPMAAPIDTFPIDGLLAQLDDDQDGWDELLTSY